MPTPNVASIPDFNVRPWRTVANVTFGSTAVFPVNVSSVNSFQGLVSIQPGAYNPVPFSAEPAMLELQANSVNMTTIQIPTTSLFGGNYTVQLVFTSGILNHNLSLLVRVLPPSPGQDFSITSLEPTQTVARNSGGNWPSVDFTIRLGSIGGFTGLVGLYPPYTWTYGTTQIFPYSVIVSPNSTVDAVLTVVRLTGSSSLTMSFTVMANTTGRVHSVEVTVNYGNLMVTASPGAVVLSPGQNSTVKVTVLSVAFSAQITLIANVAPTVRDGPVATLDSTVLSLPLNGMNTTILRISTTANTPRRSYDLFIGVQNGQGNLTDVQLIIPPSNFAVGVQVGSSASYSITSDSPVPPISLTVTVTGIVGFNVSYDADLFFRGALVNSTQSWIDIASGDFSMPSLVPFFLVAAGLGNGDSAYLGGIFQGIRIARTESFNTVGGFRNTVVADLKAPGASFSETLRWDLQTGIMVGIDAALPVNSTYTLVLHYTLRQVSAWTSLGMSFTTSMTGNRSKRAFAADVTGGEPPYTYAWSFGDGANSSLQDTDHVYAKPGNYTVVLTVSDWAGNTVSSSQLVTVARPQPPPSVSLGTGTGLVAWFRTHWIAASIILGLWIAVSLSTTIVLFYRGRKQRRSFTATSF